MLRHTDYLVNDQDELTSFHLMLSTECALQDLRFCFMLNPTQIIIVLQHTSESTITYSVSAVHNNYKLL